MKKVGFVLVMVVLSVSGLMAQSVSDDVQQLLLDVQKLSQLKQILTEMQQGYTTIKNGYENIKSLSQGTFSLHKVFLDGLLAVSPVVASYGKVADIIDKEAILVLEYQSANAYLKGSGRFTAQELSYFSAMYAALFSESLNKVNELSMVTTAGQLRMSDAQRLSAIDRMDADVTGQLSVLRAFDNGAAMQSAQRAKEAGDVGTVQGLYGIGP
jgi:hypothetical protein